MTKPGFLPVTGGSREALAGVAGVNIVDTKAARPTVGSRNPEIIIPEVSEELYVRTREALASQGFTAAVDIKPLSIAQIVEAHQRSFAPQTIDKARSLVTDGAVTPPEMQVVARPNKWNIHGSERPLTSREAVNALTHEEEEALRERLPADVRELVSMPMPCASVIMQLGIEMRYRSSGVGFILPDFRSRSSLSWHARAGDITNSGREIYIGAEPHRVESGYTSLLSSDFDPHDTVYLFKLTLGGHGTSNPYGWFQWLYPVAVAVLPRIKKQDVSAPEQM